MTPGIDYVQVPPTRVEIPAGQTAGQVTVRVFGDTHAEGNFQTLWVDFSAVTGARTVGPDPTAFSTRVDIRDDDAPVSRSGQARDDAVQAVVNEPALLHPLANDVFNYLESSQLVVEIIDPPAHGALDPQGQNGDVRFLYTPAPDFTGRDSFRYSLCLPGTGCTEATVRVAIRANHSIELTRGDRGGSERVLMQSLPPLSAARYTTSPLVAPREVSLGVYPDPTPWEPWNADSNLVWETSTIPASPEGEIREYRILLVNPDSNIAWVDAYAGIDLDGDGVPSQGEVQCSAIRPQDVGNVCETVVHVGDAPVTWWVAGHNRWPDYRPAVFEVYEIPMDASDGTLLATGPVQTDAQAPVYLQLGWLDEGFLDGDQRAGIVRLWSDAGTVLDDFTVWLKDSEEKVGLPLAFGVPRSFDVAPGSRLERVFVDVPEGATRLEVVSNSPGGMPFQLVRHPGGDDPASSAIAAAPAPGVDAVASTGVGDQRVARVEAGALHPGRWYVVPHNAGTERASVTLTASLQAVAPLVRSGSYFNPGRSGSGLMLYPAGNQWAGLWYTYESVSARPTWYYLQATAPDADGIWRSPLYRQAWYAGHAEPTIVGQATVTPVGPDLFTFTYTLYGETGSEVYSALGRGCPSLNGQPQDISSHWFDPQRAGAGYSVQVWNDYEFYAVFDFDVQGSPVFLTAESGTFAGATATLPLQRVMGACPTCSYIAPAREPAGSLRRILQGGELDSVRVDADFAESWPFADIRDGWSVLDQVRTLGGPGTTQGCAD
ncbi:Ig-like domain-containing protein [Arenimonas sp.]|uniref:Ig-like domain-containing protein n=1 Tax=Arenimonas sp. TaxID=1872635 RepID=UPI0035B0536C